MKNWSGRIEVDIEHGGEEYRLVVDVFQYVKAYNKDFSKLKYDVISFVQRDYDYNWNYIYGTASAQGIFGSWKLDTYIENAIKEKINASILH